MYYVERFKQENSIMKSSIRENFWVGLSIKPRNLSNLIKWMMHIKEWIWRKMHLKHVQQRFSWEDQTRENMGIWYMISPFSMWLRTINIQKTLQEAVDVMHNMKFKSENNNNKSNTQKQNINGDGEWDK